MDEECLLKAKIGRKEVLEETVDVKGVWTSRFVVHEEKEREEKEVSTEDVVSTDKEKVSTDRSKVSTNRSRVSIDKEEVSIDRPDEGTDDQTEGRSATPITQTPTLTTFRERRKEKGVELKDVKETEYNNLKFSSNAKSTYFSIIIIIRGNFSLYYISCIVNISVCNVTCITKVDELAQPIYGNPVFIYVKQTS
ncbi:hypothetical protein Tco_1460085 [Tanacetum coccineum]